MYVVLVCVHIHWLVVITIQWKKKTWERVGKIIVIGHGRPGVMALSPTPFPLTTVTALAAHIAFALLVRVVCGRWQKVTEKVIGDGDKRLAVWMVTERVVASESEIRQPPRCYNDRNATVDNTVDVWRRDQERYNWAKRYHHQRLPCHHGRVGGDAKTKPGMRYTIKIILYYNVHYSRKIWWNYEFITFQS